VARGFRIPHFKVGLTIERGDMVQLQQMYLNDVISTWCERFIPKLEELGDIDAEDDELFVEFDYSHFLKADIQTRLTAMRLGVVGMIYTPNEARRGEGLPDVEGGDTLYQPVNVAPIGFTPQAASGNGPGSDTTGAPGAGGHGDNTAPGEAPSAALDDFATKLDDLSLGLDDLSLGIADIGGRLAGASPSTLNLTVMMPRSTKTKTIKTHRDAEGNLVADVKEETDG